MNILGKQPPASSLAYSSFSNNFDIGNQKPRNQCYWHSPSYRWYFDIAADRCIQFNYLGTAGNANNFETNHICLDICGIGNTSDVNICLHPKVPGTGPYKIPRFYYDARNNACKQFVYTGFGGNNNRFAKHQQCSEICLNSGKKSKNTSSFNDER
ncbi:hypothetical protein LOAG_10441 [Loa loa]|uniref:BPTI/Kunitz inhibitor domain-containing protein n=1 Tax=Loa loa TaxID=7209 RepID=A0A1S0TQF4_LOALO|nr:hypothetical protein LOAG_10441 [Loa loa]EFO18056.2 hypothetical protein LOAG_10441 [Loa loa]